MKLLLVGPYPPPHGGVSVHVATARRQLRSAGVEVRVVNLNRRASDSPDYVRARGGMHLGATVGAHAARGWTVHVHSNGHNLKGWLVSLLCGVAARIAPGSILTLHSGMTPQYLAEAGRTARALAATTCRLYRRVISVNAELRMAIAGLGVPSAGLEVVPAFLGPSEPESPIPAATLEWMRSRSPLLSTAVSFRPEYGYELLIHAVAELRKRWPEIGLAVIGDSENLPVAQRCLTSRGVDGSVLLLGDLPHQICLAVMAHSDLFVRATLADGDAISVREALALGTPVVASNVGERPAGVALFKAGDLADLQDKLAHSLSYEPKQSGPQAGATEPGRVGRLLEIYAQVAG